MGHFFKALLAVCFLACLGLNAAQANEEDRTANRGITGLFYWPPGFFEKPEHYEFLPYDSNWDAQNMHPEQWKGQDWDPSKWNPKQWTPDIAVRKFFQGGIFAREYMDSRRNGKIPVLELGPKFFVLSDLDQRRTLKLLTDTTGIFKKGYGMVELRDWKTHEVVGSYLPQGMYLN